MGREDGMNPEDVDFKAPEEAGEKEQSEEKIDQAVLKSFLEKYGNEAQFDYKSFNSIIKDRFNTGEKSQTENKYGGKSEFSITVDFDRILEALERGSNSTEAKRVGEIIVKTAEIRLEQMTGTTSKPTPETPTQKINRIGVNVAEGWLSTMEKIQEKTGLLETLQDKIAKFKEDIEQTKRDR